MLKEGRTPIEVLSSIFDDVGFSVQQELPVSFFCPCNDKQIEGMLISLGREDWVVYRKSRKISRWSVNIAEKKYQFEQEDIKKMLKNIWFSNVKSRKK